MFSPYAASRPADSLSQPNLAPLGHFTPCDRPRRWEETDEGPRLVERRESALPTAFVPRVVRPKRTPDFAPKLPIRVKEAARAYAIANHDTRILGEVQLVVDWAGKRAIDTCPYSFVAAIVSELYPWRPLSPRSTRRRIAILRHIGLLEVGCRPGQILTSSQVTFPALVEAAGGTWAYRRYRGQVREADALRARKYRARKRAHHETIGQNASNAGHLSATSRFQDCLKTARNPTYDSSQKNVTATYTTGTPAALRLQPPRTPSTSQKNLSHRLSVMKISLEHPPEHPAHANAPAELSSPGFHPIEIKHKRNPHDPPLGTAAEQHPAHLGEIGDTSQPQQPSQSPCILDDEDTIPCAPSEAALACASGAEVALDAPTVTPGAANHDADPQASAEGSMGVPYVSDSYGGKTSAQTGVCGSSSEDFLKALEQFRSAGRGQPASSTPEKVPFIEKDSVYKAVTGHGSYDADGARKTLGSACFELVKRYAGSWATLCSLTDKEVREASEDIWQRYRHASAQEQAAAEANPDGFDTADKVAVALQDALDDHVTEDKIAAHLGPEKWTCVLAIRGWPLWRIKMQSCDRNDQITFLSWCQDAGFAYEKACRAKRKASEPPQATQPMAPSPMNFMDRQTLYEALLEEAKSHPHRLPIKEMLILKLTREDVSSAFAYCLKKLETGGMSSPSAFGMYLKSVLKRRSDENQTTFPT